MVMKKIERPEVRPDTPWEEDCLERKKVADYLTPVLASIRQPFVISLDSSYGTGKSFFIECWRQDLRSAGFNTVYFNAWETDFSQDALFAFIASLKRQLGSESNDKKPNDFRALVQKAAGLVRRKAVPLAIKGLTRKLVGETTFEEIEDALTEEDIVKFTESIAEESLHAQEAAENSMQEFKKFLETTVEKYTSAARSDDHKKIIIFVDELDRCRPTYAVEVLECIKHLFSVKGLVFVLAIDDAQLKNAISSVYGPNIDSEGYLRRFIDWRFKLPLPSAQRFSRYLAKKFSLSEVPNFKANSNFQDIDALVRAIGYCGDAFGLSLRKFEQYFTEINLYARSLGSDEVPFAEVLGFLVPVRSLHPDLLRDCIEQREDIYKLLQTIEPKMISVDLHPYSSWVDLKSTIHAWFVTEDISGQLSSRLNSLNKELNLIASDATKHERRRKLEEETDYLGHVIGYYNDVNRRFHFGFRRASLASYVYKRIEQAALYTGG